MIVSNIMQLTLSYYFYLEMGKNLVDVEKTGFFPQKFSHVSEKTKVEKYPQKIYRKL